MPRLEIPSRDDVPVSTRETLDMAFRRFGTTPGVFRLMASSPAVLRGFAALSDALGGVLDARLRVRIAIAVSQANGCDICLSANRYLALNEARISPEEVERNRRGGSSEPRVEAAIAFALAVTRSAGRVADGEIEAVRAAGFSDREIVEIVAVTAQALFTNLLNAVAQSDIDFPPLRAADLTHGADR